MRCIDKREFKYSIYYLIRALSYTNAVSPEDQVIRNEKEAYVRKVVNSLPARKRDAVRSRYGFDDDIEHSLDEIGVKLDVSTGRSGQIIERAIDNITEDPEIREMREDYDR